MSYACLVGPLVVLRWGKATNLYWWYIWKSVNLVASSLSRHDSLSILFWMSVPCPWPPSSTLPSPPPPWQEFTQYLFFMGPGCLMVNLLQPDNINGQGGSVERDLSGNIANGGLLALEAEMEEVHNAASNSSLPSSSSCSAFNSSSRPRLLLWPERNLFEASWLELNLVSPYYLWAR